MLWNNKLSFLMQHRVTAIYWTIDIPRRLSLRVKLAVVTATVYDCLNLSKTPVDDVTGDHVTGTCRAR